MRRPLNVPLADDFLEIEMGAKDCIRKPYTFPELKKIILDALLQLQ
jgi:hypothetical protein